MRIIVNYVLAGVLTLVLLLGLAWAIQGTDFFLYRYFAPRQEQARREVFEQSKAYNQGMVQDLQRMMFDYATATPAQQDALGSILLHRVADYDIEKLPPDLRGFILKLRRARLEGTP